MYFCCLPPGPNEPQFECCISYKNGKPTLQVTSSVCTYLIKLCSITLMKPYTFGYRLTDKVSFVYVKPLELVF